MNWRELFATRGKACAYGAWARLWATRERIFSKRTADKLVCIARHLGTLDENNRSHLPTRWSALYCLSLLGAATVERCIKEGIVHPGLTLREAKDILAKYRGQPGRLPRSNVGVRLKRFGEFVRRTVGDWRPGERKMATEELTRMVEQIGAAGMGRKVDSEAFIAPGGLLTNPGNKLMKTRYFLVLTLALLGSRANAQVPLPPTDGTSTVVESGPNHRVWQRATVDEQGRTNVSSFTELATGLNFWNSTTGQWQASQEDFELTQPGYAIARKTQHQVTVAGNQNTPVAIDLTSHDKQHFQCHVVGLAYEDGASGTNTLIAEVKDCVGQLVAPNQITFADAFTDVRADYRITLTKAGLEAEVILREQPPSPAEYGLPEATSRLQVWTEFVQAPTPTEQAALSAWGTNGVPNRFLIGPNDLTDERLSFGAMAFGQGRAFSLQTRPSGTVNLSESEVPVGKTWANIQDRHFLIESVNYLSIRPHVAVLPAAVSRQASIRHSKARRVAMNVRELKLPEIQKSRAATIRVAKADPNPPPGFVVDWVLLNSAANQTLQGDITYYISGTTILSGVTTIEAGTVVKYTCSAKSILREKAFGIG